MIVTSEVKTLAVDDSRDAETQTLVLVASEDLGGVVAILAAGAPSEDELAKMMAEGVFGESAVDILDSISGSADQFSYLLSGDFNEKTMEGIGFDLGAIGSAIADLGLTPPSSEDAFEKALADEQGQMMDEDYTGEIGQLLVGGVLVVGGMIVSGGFGGTLVLIGGFLVGDSAKDAKEKDEKEDGHTSTDPEPTNEEDPETIAVDDTSEDEDEDKTVASKEDYKPEPEKTVSTPKDPNVDGTGGGDGDLPEEDDPTGGAGDPEEDEQVFIFVNVETVGGDDLDALILKDPDFFFSPLPDIDPNNLEETTQPGSPDGNQFLDGSLDFI